MSTVDRLPVHPAVLWRERLGAYRDGVDWFLDLVAAVGQRWDEPGLGVWDVRALVGHTSRSLSTVIEHLGRPADVVEVADAAEYYRATREIAAGPGVAERGVAAGAALGTDPAASLEALRERVLAELTGCSGSEVVTTIAGGLRLVDYLATRCVELAVHGCDLAVALGLPREPPASCASEAFVVLTDLAVRDSRAGEVLLGLTGRSTLPAGFSLL